ncbi:MAG: hypothetical protein K6F50_03200 [Kiritimatiellae bacterium]|nr:hypothetical protein [Kiritimatiellia bacterium]
MTHTFKHLTVALAAGVLSLAASAASTVRLVHGGDWDKAGKIVKRTLSGSNFKSLAKGRYDVEFVEENGDMEKKNLGSWSLPCIFLISGNGNCYFVLENASSGTSAERFAAIFNKADDIREAAEKKGFGTADDCGTFLYKMEKYVGGPRKIVSDGFYPDIFKKLKELDPSDETGWQRHFTLGLPLDRSTKADGLELVIKANGFREKKNFQEGEAFIESEKSQPHKRLTKEQKQGILMAQFALQRDDASKKDELDKILEKVAAYDETTLWGTAALGWLNIRGKPPLSVYWGWHNGDFKGQNFSKSVKYGVDWAFPLAGKYKIKFVNSAGTPVKIGSITLYAGKGKSRKAVASLKNPEVDGSSYVFEMKLPRAYRGKMTSMLVKGDAPADGVSSGQILIERQVLRPRKELK